ncbi:GNAT family N-acetyltransferase [Spongiactinospora sp. TRM90649]|uniref:GNAT family N-acetyltransferase n=1 Tax=Spongiactinospora sp. TRM90649 TaxID=3031114 RepID=UPI0023F9C737|nr:GNAT family N-acetyltransferase [Spongiactinospora sp. TRM90649]MDF5758104.1 GNAT family N-acetyltransferase [Spongiactinospora sp. TRM90649]
MTGETPGTERGEGPRPSGVEVRELDDLDEFERVYRLFDEIWRFGSGAAPVTVELMRALAHSGNYVAGAYADGELVGASVGFLSAPAGRALHSHVTGTREGGGTGFALKLHQREWALARGLDTITWTYDPLVRRNAHFNLTKLGALPTEYLRDFYGVMDDAINTGEESDRVLASWDLNAPRVAACCSGVPYRPAVSLEAAVALEDRGGRPLAQLTGADVVLVAVPADIELTRRRDPLLAREWRLAVRETLGGLMDGGARVTGFHHRTYYVVEKA